MPTSKLWKWIFILSFPLGIAIVSNTFTRGSDADDAMGFYEGGMRSWGDVTQTVFLPPTIFKITPATGNAGLEVPRENVFVFDRWRPFSTFFMTKALWSLGLSPKAYKLINWFLLFAASLAFSWGIVQSLKQGFPMATGSVWALAALTWWAPPNFFTASDPFFHLYIPLGLGGLGAGLLCRSYQKRKTSRFVRWTLRGVTLIAWFLACQTHETAWWVILSFGIWFTLIRFPGFWFPFVLVLFHMVVFRSIAPSSSTQWSGSGLSISPFWLITNGSYLLLAMFNGLAEPLVQWLGASRHPLDIQPMEAPIALILTVIALVLAWKNASHTLSPKQRTHWKFECLALAGISAAVIAPFLLIQGHRFIHYALLPNVFLGVVITGSASTGKKLKSAPLILLLAANFMGALQFVQSRSWLDVNANSARQFTDNAHKQNPELGSCSSNQPCCITVKSGGWLRNAWVLSWNAGAEKHPPYIPEGWPGVTCAKHLVIE